jgi:hypothetical protein
MAQLKNNTGREYSIKGVVGAIAPGDSRAVGTGTGEVPPDIAQEYKSYPGWELIEDKPGRGSKKDRE